MEPKEISGDWESMDLDYVKGEFEPDNLPDHGENTEEEMDK